MGTILSIFLCLLCLAEAFRDIKRSLAFFLVAILFAPYMIFGSIYVRIELPLTPIYIAILIARRDIGTIRIPVIVWPLILLWSYTLGITLISTVGGLAVSPVWINTYSYFLRPMLLLALFANAGFNEQDLTRLLRWFAASAIPLALLAAGQTFGIQTATDLTMSAYMSPARVVIANLMENLGVILRAVSVFEVPSSAATFFLAALVTSIYLLTDLQKSAGGRRRFILPLLSLFASLLGGVLTLTATFVAGAGLVFLMFFLRLEWQNKIRIILISALFGTVIVSYLMLLSQEQEHSSVADSINYQAQRVLSVHKLFRSRYAGNTGFLQPTIREIKDNPLIGYGWMRKTGVFIGDSMYVVLLYQSGIIGMTLFAIFLIMLFHAVATNRFVREILFFWLFVLLIAGVGVPSLFIARLNDWWWALCGIGIGISLTERVRMAEDVIHTTGCTHSKKLTGVSG